MPNGPAVSDYSPVRGRRPELLAAGNRRFARQAASDAYLCRGGSLFGGGVASTLFRSGRGCGFSARLLRRPPRRRRRLPPATGTVLCSLTVLPALLSRLGDRVSKRQVSFLRPPGSARRREASGARSSGGSCGGREGWLHSGPHASSRTGSGLEVAVAARACAVAGTHRRRRPVWMASSSATCRPRRSAVLADSRRGTPHGPVESGAEPPGVRQEL